MYNNIIERKQDKTTADRMDMIIKSNEKILQILI